jgi:endonuclease/exonuclease/phosphatase family metal-dependent hydrolase
MKRALLILLAACGTGEAVVTGEEPTSDEQQGLAVPTEDRPDSVDVGSWNIEWYGDPLNGPSPEWRQQTNVERVLPQLDLDLLGVVEVVSKDAFAHALTKLPDHDGFLADDPRVENGAAFYGPSEQKVGLVFRRRFTVESARLIITEQSHAFAGRPPMEVKLKFSENGRARTLVLIVAHFKAMANLDGWTRRTAAAAALKTYLDTTYATRWVLVVGDWNDDVDVSTYRGSTSPFDALAHDPGYRFTTDALTAANIATTVGFSSTIDHHLATDELAARYVAGSAHVVRLDQYVWQYGTTTSDHYPVVTRYDLR